MPICMAFETLVGEVDECAVTVLLVVKRPFRVAGDPCIEEDRVAVLSVATQVLAVVQDHFPTLEPRPVQ